MEQARYPDDWKLLSATSELLMPSRLKALWSYVILGGKPRYTIEAWVSPRKDDATTFGGLKLFVRYPRFKSK